jgi:hypothetical protein
MQQDEQLISWHNNQSCPFSAPYHSSEGVHQVWTGRNCGQDAQRRLAFPIHLVNVQHIYTHQNVHLTFLP